MSVPVYSSLLCGAPATPGDTGLIFIPDAGTVWVIKGISITWGFTVVDVHAWVYTEKSGKIAVVYNAGPGVNPGQLQEFGSWCISSVDGDKVGVATDGNSVCDFSVNGYVLTLP